jgi:hypothetical protein
MLRGFEWPYVLALLAFGGLFGTACASTQTLLAQRFSKEHSCQKDAVMVHEAGSNVYRAEGCGQRTEYVCQSFAGGQGSERSCAERGVNPNTPTDPVRRAYPNVQDAPR